MQDLIFLLIELLNVFVGLENGKEILIKERRKIDFLTCNIQANKTIGEDSIENDIVITIKKLENELYSDSLISYICILNLMKYLNKHVPNKYLNHHPAIEKFNNFMMKKDVYNDYVEVMTLKELLGNVEEAENENFRLITTNLSFGHYIIDNDNFLWVCTKHGVFKTMIDKVKYISISNGGLVGIDTDGKFWKCDKDSYKKEYIEKLSKYTFDRLYDMPDNNHLLISTNGKNILIDVHKEIIDFETFAIPLNQIVDVAFNQNITMFISDENEVYNKHKIQINTGFSKCYINDTNVILIDKFGVVHEQGNISNKFNPTVIPEKIKDVAFTTSGPVFLSYTGNVYGRAKIHSDPTLIASNVSSIHEVFEGVILVNKDETRLLKFSFDLRTAPYYIHYGNSNILKK